MKILTFMFFISLVAFPHAFADEHADTKNIYYGLWSGGNFTEGGLDEGVMVSSYEDLEDLAYSGDLQAQLKIAFFHFGDLDIIVYNGETPEKDFQSALRWFKSASEIGSQKADYHLALMYFIGLGTRKDHPKSLMYLSKALQVEKSL